jgi:hypothetical protein
VTNTHDTLNRRAHKDIAQQSLAMLAHDHEVSVLGVGHADDRLKGFACFYAKARL